MNESSRGKQYKESFLTVLMVLLYIKMIKVASRIQRLKH